MGPMANWTLRQLQPSDIDALIELWQRAGLPFKPEGRDTPTAIADQLAQPMAIYLGAFQDGALIGAVLGTHDGRKGWINRLAVDPERRGQGVGRALVERVEARLRAQGIEIVAALVEAWNETSLEVFDALGYVRHPGIHYLSKRAHPDA